MELKKFYQGKKVFLTGHTGFKGAWLTLILKEMGAEVFGYSLSVPSTPSFYELSHLNISEKRADIDDYKMLHQALYEFRPDIVIHMAAQSLVLESYKDPLFTFRTNIMGTANLFEICRNLDEVKVILNVTSDKCYHNTGHLQAYTELDALGGSDPYSASKACAELVNTAMYKSFFQHKDDIAVVSARAGNVVGGGDWSENRLVPDCIRSLKTNSPLKLRNPESVRPWQHVLDALNGYLKLVQASWFNKKEMSGAWNFGPESLRPFKVIDVINSLSLNLNKDIPHVFESSDVFEQPVLMIDSTKSAQKLNWTTQLSAEQTFEWTAKWYATYLNNQDTLEISKQQVRDFFKI